MPKERISVVFRVLLSHILASYLSVLAWWVTGCADPIWWVGVLAPVVVVIGILCESIDVFLYVNAGVWDWTPEGPFLPIAVYLALLGLSLLFVWKTRNYLRRRLRLHSEMLEQGAA